MCLQTNMVSSFGESLFRDLFTSSLALTRFPPIPHHALQILSRIRSLHPEATIIVFTPPPVDEDNWKRNTEGGVLNRTNAAARQYADKAIDVAKNFQNTHLYDVHRYLEGDADRANYAKYLNDGLHLSEEGNKKVFEGLMGTLEAHCKEEIWPVDEVCPFEEKVWRDML